MTGGRKQKTLVQSEKWSENKPSQTICKYSGCVSYHVSPSLASNKEEKSSPLDCLVLLGTSDIISADVSVSEPGYFSYSLYKTIFVGSKHLKEILLNFEN